METEKNNRKKYDGVLTHFYPILGFTFVLVILIWIGILCVSLIWAFIDTGEFLFNNIHYNRKVVLYIIGICLFVFGFHFLLVNGVSREKGKKKKEITVDVGEKEEPPKNIRLAKTK